MRWQEIPVAEPDKYRQGLLEAMHSIECHVTRGLEVGLGWGVSGLTFLERFPNAALLSCDINTELPASERLSNDFPERFRFLHADRIEEFVQLFIHPPALQWLYIDGGHEYEEVKRDIRVFEPWLEPGGVIMFDDYANKNPKYKYPGVSRAVNKFFAKEGDRFKNFDVMDTLETGPAYAVKIARA